MYVCDVKYIHVRVGPCVRFLVSWALRKLGLTLSNLFPPIYSLCGALSGRRDGGAMPAATHSSKVPIAQERLEG